MHHFFDKADLKHFHETQEEMIDFSNLFFNNFLTISLQFSNYQRFPCSQKEKFFLQKTFSDTKGNFQKVLSIGKDKGNVATSCCSCSFDGKFSFHFFHISKTAASY